MKHVFLMLAALTLLGGASQANAATIFVYGQQGTVGKYDASNGSTIKSNFESLNLGGNDGFGIVADNENHLFVADILSHSVSEYNASTGTLISANFVNAFGVEGLAVDDNRHLFVADENGVGEYNTSNGSTVNAQLVSLTDHDEITGLAVDNEGHLFAAYYVGEKVAEYNTSDGSVVNANLITSNHPFDPQGIAVDNAGHLFVVNPYNDTVGEYNSSNGVAINASLIGGFETVFSGVTVDNVGHVFVTDNGSIGEYTLATGVYNANFIQNLGYPNDVAYEPTYVPEPSSLILAIAAIMGSTLMIHRIRQTHANSPRLPNR